MFPVPVALDFEITQTTNSEFGSVLFMVWTIALIFRRQKLAFLQSMGSCYTSTKHCYMNMNSGFFPHRFGQFLQSPLITPRYMVQKQLQPEVGEVFTCRGFLGTATCCNLQERKKNLLLAYSSFRETLSAGLDTGFMLKQFFNKILRCFFFKENNCFPSF